jgi:hypothetical protein
MVYRSFIPTKNVHNSFLSPIYIGYSSESVDKGLWDKNLSLPFPHPSTKVENWASWVYVVSPH